MSPRFLVPTPFSGGLILSYQCSCECKHCMYFGTPAWKDGWIKEKNLREILSLLSKVIKPSPLGKDRVSLNHGLHFTGGEPFLNYKILLKSIEIASELEIPSLFVETNCYWCKNDKITEKRLLELKNKGLQGILISVNPFILEHVPFERIERAIKISNQLFEDNLMIYQLYYYVQFKNMKIKGILNFDDYLKLVKIEEVKRRVELFKMGRAAHELSFLYERFPLKVFLNENCKMELVRNWHCHFDLHGNYMPGYCGGFSWGDVRNLDLLSKKGIELEKYPIFNALINGKLKDLHELAVKNFNYQELRTGYVSKCHACFDIRKHLALKTNVYKELQPREFYFHS